MVGKILGVIGVLFGVGVVLGMWLHVSEETQLLTGTVVMRRSDGAVELCTHFLDGRTAAYVIDTDTARDDCAADAEVLGGPVVGQPRRGGLARWLFYPGFELGQRLASDSHVDLGAAAWRARAGRLGRLAIVGGCEFTLPDGQTSTSLTDAIARCGSACGDLAAEVDRADLAMGRGDTSAALIALGAARGGLLQRASGLGMSFACASAR